MYAKHWFWYRHRACRANCKSFLHVTFRRMTANSPARSHEKNAHHPPAMLAYCVLPHRFAGVPAVALAAHVAASVAKRRPGVRGGYHLGRGAGIAFGSRDFLSFHVNEVAEPAHLASSGKLGIAVVSHMLHLYPARLLCGCAGAGASRRTRRASRCTSECPNR